MSAKESEFQSSLIKRIHSEFPEAIVMKNDSGYLQGVPDLTILNDANWAALEVKKSKSSKHQPNQDYYVKMMDGMSYAAFVDPENVEEVMDALQRTLRA